MSLHGVGLRTLGVVLASVSMSAYAQTSVPYVGCPGDGQTGPYRAAKGSPKPVTLPLEVANKLAWYEYKGDAGEIGTLGPRGWNCFVTIGSDGETLYVAPEAMNSAKILEHKNWKGFKGPAIQLSGSDGGTSGRFEVARWWLVFARRIATTPARSSQRASVPPQIILSVLSHLITSLIKVRSSSSSPLLAAIKASARFRGFCHPISPSSASPCSPSDLTSMRDFYS